jgi:hypothetical protein
MLNAAQVLPAGSGGLDSDVFPLRERLRFRDSFGLALLELRARTAPFQGLAKGPWALFIAIAVHWQGNAEAWPSQEALARFSGWSSRAVRDQADALEGRGFIRIRRERRPDGSERIFYAPGLVTLSALAYFVERFPRERAKSLGVARPAAEPDAPPTPAHPAEASSAAPPEEVSMERIDQDQIEPSSCGAHVEAAAAMRPTEEEQGQVTREDEEVARRALVERMAKKHPTSTAPRWFDAGELAMVSACAAAIEGNVDAKVLAQRDAIAGAFLASKDGPPTVRFIWGKLDHFLDHVERGRRRRLADERAARRSPEASEHHSGARLAQPTPIPGEVIAELERLFGPGWKTNRAGRDGHHVARVSDHDTAGAEA